MSASTRKILVILVAVALVVAAAVVFMTRDDVAGGGTTRSGDRDASSTTASESAAADGLENHARTALRGPVVGERFYFVLPDRFTNGDPDNDHGGRDADLPREEHGLDPTDDSFFHGGDLQGVRSRLDYLEGLGVTAIWLTPVMVNQPVQGEGDDASAAYHGYWVTDFTGVEPRLGSEDDLQALIDDAHDRGMKVFLDIITNHTGDVIDYEEQEYDYRPIGQDPYTPVFREEGDASLKVPEWLNDTTLYNNRGNSTFQGESSITGDFQGLDDLDTSRPEVVEGMIEIYTDWIDLGVDGFRIDTVKHVDIEFWQEFAPAMLEHAERVGNEEFFMFGEVYDANPAAMSLYTTTGTLPATLDFGFQAAATDFIKGGPASGLAQLYEGDDRYLDADSNASVLPTFLGNHDMGRAAMLYGPAALLHDDLQDRVELAHSLMFLTRGQPVVYYGDEQGFVGRGGDKAARQDMFATQVEAWAEQDGVDGEPLGDEDHFDTQAPLYQHIAALSDLREEHPALSAGAQVTRLAEGGVFAASRILATDGVEHLVVVNNGTEPVTVDVPTASPDTTFDPLWGGQDAVTADSAGTLAIEVPALSAMVLKAASPMAASEEVSLSLAAGELRGRSEVRAELTVAQGPAPFAEVTFLARAAGADEEGWTVLGTDDAPPYRIYPDAESLPAGDLELAAVAAPWQGPVVTTTASTTVVHAPEQATSSVPEGQPAQVVAAGTFQAALGCAQDWDPACTGTALSYDEESGLWQATFDLPEGENELKIALAGTWEENYGRDGAPDGENIAIPGGAPVRVTYDHASHEITVEPTG